MSFSHLKASDAAGFKAKRPISAPRLPRAFTLIELLVVISIISLLIAILLPALQSARAVTRQTLCKSNLRQVALADIYYAADQKQYLPSLRTSGVAGPTSYRHNVVFLVDAYFQSSLKTWKCPTDEISPVYYERYGYQQITGNQTGSEIAIGVFPLFEAHLEKPGTLLSPLTLNNWQSYRLDLVDSAAMAHGELLSTTAVVNMNTASVAYGEGLLGRRSVRQLSFPHPSKQGNLSFLDGHVENMSLEDANSDMRGNRWPGD